MKQHNWGFTLMEILLAMSILIVGLVGILALFPAGLNATRKAMEDTNAALIAESAYSSLRAAARQTSPGGNLNFFHDGVTASTSTFGPFSETVLAQGKAIGLPKHYDANNLTTPATSPVTITDYRVLNYGPGAPSLTDTLAPLANAFYKLGTPMPASPPAPDANTVYYNQSDPNTQQYGFNIQLAYTSGNPRGLYDVTIRVIRANRLVRTFYSQIFIPTAP